MKNTSPEPPFIGLGLFSSVSLRIQKIASLMKNHKLNKVEDSPHNIHGRFAFFKQHTRVRVNTSVYLLLNDMFILTFDTRLSLKKMKWKLCIRYFNKFEKGDMRPKICRA